MKNAITLVAVAAIGFYLAGCGGAGADGGNESGGPGSPVLPPGFYVSVSGSPGATGSPDDPFSTISEAITASESSTSDPVYVSSGLYDELVLMAGGVDLFGGYNPTTWERDPSAYETVIVNSTGGITVNAGANATIDGFTIRTFPDGGDPTESYESALIMSSGSPTISNNRIIGGATDTLTGQSRTIHIQGSASPTIEDNSILGSDGRRAADAIGISMASNASGTTILRNNTIEAGESERAAWGILSYGGTIVSEGNSWILREGAASFSASPVRLEGSSGNGSMSVNGDTFLIDVPSSTGAVRALETRMPFVLRNSIIRAETGTGLFEAFSEISSATIPSTVVNNTIVVDSSTASSRPIFEIPVDGWTIENNIVHLTGSGNGSFSFVDAGQNSYTENNNFYYYNGLDLSNFVIGSNIWSDQVDYVKFVDRAGGNYDLTSSTPTAITGGGADTSSHGVTTDHAGRSRSNPYSIGAFER